MIIIIFSCCNEAMGIDKETLFDKSQFLASNLLALFHTAYRLDTL